MITNNDNVPFWAFGVLLVLTMISNMLWAATAGNTDRELKALRQEAIARGHAQEVIAGGSKKFIWNTNPIEAK